MFYLMIRNDFYNFSFDHRIKENIDRKTLINIYATFASYCVYSLEWMKSKDSVLKWPSIVSGFNTHLNNVLRFCIAKNINTDKSTQMIIDVEKMYELKFEELPIESIIWKRCEYF